MSEAELSKYMIYKKAPYVKPLYSINYKKEDEVLSWFQNAEENCSNYYRALFREQQENLVYFLGSGLNPHFASPFAATFATTSDVYAQPQQVYINEMYRLTMAQVSLVVSNELSPDVLPNTTDYKDRVACNVVKEWLESQDYDLNTELWRVRWEIQKKAFGESFVIPMWNPNIGDIHPMSRKYMDGELDLLDENGQRILNLDGNPIKIKKNMRIGDIEYINPMPWDVQIDPQMTYDAANWFYWQEWMDVEYLKKKYPKLNFEKPSANKFYDAFSNTEKDNDNRRVVYYFFHRAMEFMPEGRFIVATKQHVLINTPMDMPTLVNDQLLPLVRFVDLDTGNNTRGVPILFRNCKPSVDAYNRVTNQIYNNIEMESPKVFVHETAGVDLQRMPNGPIVIEWRGNHKPTIETPPTNTTGIFNFRESLKKSAEESAFQTPMVRGDVPNAQLDSFIALQHFEDQRVQLAGPDIKGHIRSMENLYRMRICIAKDKYQPDDGRLIKILGKHNSVQLKYFDPTNLDKTYDVRISTTGNLANSKAARSQMMMTIKEKFPHIVSDEFFLDTLGISHSKKFMTAITAAVTAAESENQDMYDNVEVEDPTRYEDLISHWETHRIPMQTLDFKKSPPDIQEHFIRHVTATEKLMFEQAVESPTFAERLQMLRQFPMFFTPGPVNEQLLPQQMLPPAAGPESIIPPEAEQQMAIAG